MPQRLILDSIERIALVDRGDNPTANVLIHKRREPELKKRAETFSEAGNRDDVRRELWDVTDALNRALHSALFEAEDDQDPEQIINDSLDQFTAAVRSHLPSWLEGEPMEKGDRSLLKRFVDFLKGEPHDGGGVMPDGDKKYDFEKIEDEELRVFVKALAERAEKAEAKIAEMEKADGDADDPEGIDKSELPEPVRKALEAAEERAEKAEKDQKDLSERMEKIEAEKRRERFIAKAAALDHVPAVTPDDFAPVLMAAEGALEQEQFDKLMDVLSKANELLKTSAVFAEIGAGGRGGENAELAAAESEVGKAHPDWSPEQVRAHIYKTRPQLYQKVAAEHRDRTRREG